MGGGSMGEKMMEGELKLELGLGLSLGGGGGGGSWGDCGRILTARDFPYVGSKRAAAESVSQEGAESPPRSSQVVGWPPIGSHRMNSLMNQSKTLRPDDDEEEEEEEEDNRNDKSKKKEKPGGEKDSAGQSNDAAKKNKVGFVKVNLDGIPIGRKVDLDAHSRYDTLAYSLEVMFFNSKSSIISMGSNQGKEKPKPSKLLDGLSEFVLTYEDKEGDWMLVGDVPWRMFITSVRRLRIMKTSEANGLAPRFRERNETQKNRPI